MKDFCGSPESRGHKLRQLLHGNKSLARGGYLAARLTVSMTSSDFVRHRSCLTTIIAAFGKPHQPSREHPAKTAATEPNRILSPSFSSTSVTGRPLTRVPFVECKSCSR